MAESKTGAKSVPDDDLDHLSGPATPDETVVEEEVPAPEPEPATATATHPDILLNRARYMGVSDDHAKQLSTAELDQLVFDLQRQQWARENPSTPASPAKSDEKVEENDDEVISYLETELGMDKRAVAMFRRQAKRIKELESTTGKIKDIEDRDIKRQISTANDAFDSAFEALGEDSAKIFGSGDGQSLPNDSVELQLRNTAIKAAGIVATDGPLAIRRKVEKAGKKVLAKFIQAKAAAPAPPAQPAPKAAPTGYEKNGTAPRITSEEWEKAALAKPTHAKPKPNRGEAAGLEAIRNFYREHNIDYDNEATLDGVS